VTAFWSITRSYTHFGQRKVKGWFPASEKARQRQNYPSYIYMPDQGGGGGVTRCWFEGLPYSSSMPFSLSLSSIYIYYTMSFTVPLWFSHFFSVRIVFINKNVSPYRSSTAHFNYGPWSSQWFSFYRDYYYYYYYFITLIYK